MRRETRLKELVICSTTPRLGNDEIKYIARGLRKNSNLMVLDLTGANFDANGLQELRSFFEKNRSLEVLSLGENTNVGDDGLQVVLSSLRHDARSLRALNLESCGLNNFASAVPDLMQSVGSSLRILELSNNRIGDSGLEQLAKCVMVPACKLEHLGLKNTSVGDYGLLKLAAALMTNTSLQTLNLQNNAAITDAGASHLLTSIYNTDSISSIARSNHILKVIDLKGCINISNSILYKIYDMANQTVQYKVSKYFESFGCISALGLMDSLLMSNLLSFVGKKNGLDVLFRTVKSIPLLYNNIPKVDPTKVNDSSTSFTLNESKTNSRRIKQCHHTFSTIPKVMFAVRCTDGRNRSKKESCTRKSKRNYLAKALSTTILY